jgi:hypothetical protein
MAERKKTNLQTLRDLTETLCVTTPDSQCGRCQQLFQSDGCPLSNEVSKAKVDMTTVLEALKSVIEECVSLKTEIASLKKQVKTIKGE